MKRSILFKAGLIASVCFMAVNASAAGASGGTITFNGKITSSTCDSALEGSAANEVTMPDVATNAFTGDTAGRTSFNILLTSCVLDKDTGVAAYFEPDANWVDMDTGHLNNIAVAGAEGVSLQLLNGDDDTAINVGDAAQETLAHTVVPDAQGNGTLPYFVEYFKVAGGTLKAGAVQGKVTYSLIYR